MQNIEGLCDLNFKIMSDMVMSHQPHTVLVVYGVIRLIIIPQVLVGSLNDNYTASTCGKPQ